MDERYAVHLEDLSEGTELEEEELRAIVGAQRSCFDIDSDICTCGADGVDDCD